MPQRLKRTGDRVFSGSFLSSSIHKALLYCPMIQAAYLILKKINCFLFMFCTCIVYTPTLLLLLFLPVHHSSLSDYTGLSHCLLLWFIPQPQNSSCCIKAVVFLTSLDYFLWLLFIRDLFIIVWYFVFLVSHTAAAAQAQAEERRSLAGTSPAPVTASAAKSHAKPGTSLNITSNLPMCFSFSSQVYLHMA